MLPGPMPQAVQDRMDQDAKRQCRVIGINTMNFLMEKGVVTLTGDPHDVLDVYLSMCARVAAFVERNKTKGSAAGES